VHGIAEHQSLFDAAFLEAFLHLRSNVYECSPCRDFKPEFFSVAFHEDPFLINAVEELSHIFLKS
jgi:hypothetical protein